MPAQDILLPPQPLTSPFLPFTQHYLASERVSSTPPRECKSHGGLPSLSTGFTAVSQCLEQGEVRMALVCILNGWMDEICFLTELWDLENL